MVVSSWQSPGPAITAAMRNRTRNCCPAAGDRCCRVRKSMRGAGCTKGNQPQQKRTTRSTGGRARQIIVAGRSKRDGRGRDNPCTDSLCKPLPGDTDDRPRSNNGSNNGPNNGSTYRPTFRVGTYNNGQPYIPARGRYAPRERVEDYLAPSHAVIDLPRQKPTAADFVRVIVREMKIRFYSQKTIKTYRNDLARLLRWFGNPPHLLTREDVRCYLEFLVDAGASASQVGNHLSAIRAAFDKMCGYAVTLGLQSPRRGKRLPVVLSAEEVTRLLQAAPSLRDKLLLGLMYATGMRVSEVCRLKWRDLDFDRRVVNIWEGKGRTDRQVMLPVSFEPLLRELSKTFQPGDYLFPGERHRPASLAAIRRAGPWSGR